MPTHLYLAPAAAGKTAFILDLARRTAHGLAAEARVVVASHLQVRAARRRLAEMGGAIGVRVLTFDRLYAEILSAAAETYVELSDAVQYRLLRALLDASRRQKNRPGLPLPLRGEGRCSPPLLYTSPAGRLSRCFTPHRRTEAAGIDPDDFTPHYRCGRWAPGQAHLPPTVGWRRRAGRDRRAGLAGGQR
jgi:hypothetical protein